MCVTSVLRSRTSPPSHSRWLNADCVAACRNKAQVETQDLSSSGGSGCQPSLTREITSQASIVTPRMRRKGFPHAVPRRPPQCEGHRGEDDQDNADPALGWPSHITADASNHTASCQLGRCVSVIRPVFRLRNIQSINPFRFSVSSGVLNDVLPRVDVLPRDPTG